MHELWRVPSCECDAPVAQCTVCPYLAVALADARRNKYCATASIPNLIDRLPDGDEKSILLQRSACLVSTYEELSASYHGAKSANDGALAHA
eukprot:COSAG01_NODE_1942_length_8842_cov_5.900492_9_plen_92_part_00